MLHIKPFLPEHQAIAKKIVQIGLGSRFGHIDETMNPDLNDIQTTYVAKGHHFFVAEVDGKIIGTCALTNEAPNVGRIERMSVLEACQGRGYARQMTNFLIETARNLGMTKMVVETNDTWESALYLYKSAGFAETHRDGVEVHMMMQLD